VSSLFAAGAAGPIADSKMADLLIEYKSMISGDLLLI